MDDITSGYDTNFIGDVPTYLKCIICQLVLKDPVMLVECGHRFCRSCFEAMKLNTGRNSQLCCPYDRMEVNQKKVVDDKGISRVVLDLQVKCDNYSHGCLWTGELRNLKCHVKEDCSFTGKRSFMEQVKQLDEKTQQRLKEFEDKLYKWETSLHTRDDEYNEIKEIHQQRNEEIAVLKEQVHHLHTKLDSKMDSKVSLLNLQMEKSNKQLKKSKSEIASLKVKLHNMNMNIISNQLIEKEYIQNINPFHIAVKVKEEPMEVSNSYHFESTTSVVASDGYHFETDAARDVVSVKNVSDGRKTEDPEVDPDNSMQFEEVPVEPEDESDSIQQKEISEETENDWDNKTIPIVTSLSLSCHTNDPLLLNEEDIMSNKNNEDKTEQLLCRVSERLRFLEEQTVMMEQLLANKETIFKWVLQDYTFHMELGDAVFSPTFYGSVDAHWCRLWVRWGKKGLDLSFELCLGSGSSTLKKFRMKVDLEIIDKYGIKEHNTIPSSYFKEPKLGYSFRNFIKEPRLKDFIVKDCLFITCILTPE